MHIDSHYWQVFDGERVELTPEQWKACHRRLIDDDAWVIDGMKFGVLDQRLARADTVIYLDLPTGACLSGIARRRIRYRGVPRPDLGVYDRITWAQLKWVWWFRRRHRPLALAKLAHFDGHRAVLEHRRDIGRFLDTVAPPTTATDST